MDSDTGSHKPELYEEDDRVQMDDSAFGFLLFCIGVTLLMLGAAAIILALNYARG